MIRFAAVQPHQKHSVLSGTGIQAVIVFEYRHRLQSRSCGTPYFRRIIGIIGKGCPFQRSKVVCLIVYGNFRKCRHIGKLENACSLIGLYRCAIPVKNNDRFDFNALRSTGETRYRQENPDDVFSAGKGGRIGRIGTVIFLYGLNGNSLRSFRGSIENQVKVLRRNSSGAIRKVINPLVELNIDVGVVLRNFCRNDPGRQRAFRNAALARDIIPPCGDGTFFIHRKAMAGSCRYRDDTGKPCGYVTLAFII